MLDMLTIKFYLLSKPVAPDFVAAVSVQLSCKCSDFLSNAKIIITFADILSLPLWIVHAS